VLIDSSDSSEYFGYESFRDFKSDPEMLRYPNACPIRSCITTPVLIPFGKSNKPFCSTHGIRLHSNTFVYWNGDGRKEKNKARLRNFRIRPDLAEKIALNSVGKAETHRLGYENSEDALTWNVFVSLAEAKKLSLAVKFLTGFDVGAEPDLYLWGKLVDVTGTRNETELFQPLRDVRDLLEQGIRKFNTEPDVMLVLDGQLVICVEAKFTSGNTLAHEEEVEVGDKPKDRNGLLERYFDEAPEGTKRAIKRDKIGANLHSQLFRNIIFASAMAKGCKWHVANLVSQTQWNCGKKSKQNSFVNPEESIRSYLNQSFQNCFSFRTWEQLYRELVKDDAELDRLNTYFLTKSAHYRRAFELD